MFKLKAFIAPIYIFLAIKFFIDINLFIMIKKNIISRNTHKHLFHSC